MLGIILTDSKTTGLKLPPIVSAIEALKPRKPVIFAALDEGAPFDFPELQKLRNLGVACFPSPERALRALAHVTRRGRQGESRDCGLVGCTGIPPLRSGLLSEAESKEILAQIGIPIPNGRVAATAEQAVRIAREIGYPVVLKAQSVDLPHKSDVGAVVLGIGSEADLLDGWFALHRNLLKVRPDLALDGVLVERMGDKGLELIVGAQNDPAWGPVLMAGFGGVLAEVMEDVRLMPADLSREEIERELSQLRCGALLKGFRGAPEVDVAAAVAVVETIGRLIRSNREIGEIDINPLVVYEKGKGALALDALISVTEKDH
jgi:acyl-CoA synthetase (NDP forming)